MPQEPLTFGYLPDSVFYNAQLASIVPQPPPTSTQTTTTTTTTTKGKGGAKAPAQKKPRATAASRNNRVSSNYAILVSDT